MKLMIAVLIGLAVQGFLSPPCTAQGLILIPRDTTLTGSLGSEFVFDVLIRNGSASPLGVSVCRIENQLLPGWQSSLCFGTACFPPGVDSIATTRTFGSGPLNPGDSLDFSVHMTALTARLTTMGMKIIVRRKTLPRRTALRPMAISRAPMTYAGTKIAVK